MKSKIEFLAGMFRVGISAMLIVAIASCKRDDADPFFGPAACPSDSFKVIVPFTISASDGDTVNFTLGEKATFLAEFSEPAPWTITLTGTKSHAVKTFSGFSDSISENWYNRPGSLPFFMDEEITVDFKIRCRTDLNETSEFYVVSVRDFSNDPNVLYVADFDGTGNDVPSNSWLAYHESDLVNGNGVIDTAYFPTTSKSGFLPYKSSPQGGGYLSFKGIKAIPAGESKNLYGSYEIYTPAMKDAPLDAKNMWFNFMANSGGTPIKVIVNFWHWNGKDRFGKASFTIKSSEWGMYSINLAELEKGPGIEETFNPANVGIVFFTIVQGEAIAPSYFNLDMATFTYNESFYGEVRD